MSAASVASSKQNSNRLMCIRHSFTSFLGGLKPPMDTYLHAYSREVNQNPVTMPGRLVVMFWPHKNLRSHLIVSNSKKKFLGTRLYCLSRAQTIGNETKASTCNCLHVIS